MHRLSATKRCFYFFLLMIFNSHAYGFGEVLLDKLLRSDFIYDRGITELPFIPIGYLAATHQDTLTLEPCPLTKPACEYKYQSLAQGAGIPVWVGQKNMLIVGQTLNVDVFEADGDSLTINTGGLMAAWISQHSESWQSGAFAYHYQNLDSDMRSDDTRGTYAGMVGRYRHSPTFHSYWGAVVANTSGESRFYPYIGFDWYINNLWAVTAVFPWPSVSYSLNEAQLLRVGALVSEVSWAVKQDNSFYTQDFSQMSLGFAFEQKISQLLWAEFSAGYTGLGTLQINTDAESSIKTDVESQPFIKLALNVRPF